VSRSGYSDDYDDPLEVGRWRAIIASASRGKRGQKFFRDLVTALDALPVKELVAGDLEKEGSVCALGALGKHRGVDLNELDTTDWNQLGETFNIAQQLAQETMYMNDEYGRQDPASRWETVREWAAKEIVPTESELV